MFILVDKSNDGVYAVRDQEKKKVVHIFQERDDAERYLTLMEANDAPKAK